MPEQLSFALKHIYPDDETGITLEVILSSGSEQMRVPAKVDCGAACCIFSREIGMLLGLDIESGLPKRMGSLTGTLDTFGHEVTIQFSGIAVHTVAYFAKHHGLARNLLGRRGWLRNLRMAVIDYDQLLYLEFRQRSTTSSP